MLAYFLLSYGFGKVFESQFGLPSFRRLIQPYGTSSPMGLAWTFMGYSSAYRIFAGALEVVSGLLLLHRGTTTLGALLSIAVMSNIVMMNFCFDICVKLFSTMLLLISIGILFPELNRILSVLLLNRPVGARKHKPHFSDPRWRKLALAGKLVLVAVMLVHNINRAWDDQEQYGRDREKPPLYGLYRVETFIKDGVEHPPLITDEKRWGHMWFEYEGYLGVAGMEGQRYGLPCIVDEAAQSITVPLEEGDYVWSYQKPSPDVLIIEGVYMKSRYTLHLKRRNMDDFLHMSRGFHWINEYPYNR